MPDSGITSQLEAWFATQLAQITDSGRTVFRTAEVWKHQVAATSGGMEAFDRYAPFAFVSVSGTTPAREGDYDLREIFETTILIGQSASSPGVARFGSTRTHGTGSLRDLVVAAFDRQVPESSLACDEIYLTDEGEVLDAPKAHAIELVFQTSRMRAPA